MRKTLKALIAVAVLIPVSAQSLQAEVITDFSNFSQSGNMLNSASHNREQSFTPTGTDISIAHVSSSVGSAGQAIWGTDEFASFTTVGYRLSVNLTEIDWDGGTTARVGLMTSDAIPAGGTSSGDVRASGDYFYWTYRAGSVMAGMFSDGPAGEEEASLVSVGVLPDPSNGIVGDITGLYMERVIHATNGASWDLGYIDENGQDVLVQNRAAINGEAITTDGTFVGLYSDMRSANEVRTLSNLSYGLVTAIPEPGSFALCCFGVAALAVRRRR